jgi:hypothetical protein
LFLRVKRRRLTCSLDFGRRLRVSHNQGSERAGHV